MGAERGTALIKAAILVAATVGVVWLATKIARTPEGNYRLVVIGAAIVLVGLAMLIPAGMGRSRR